MLLVIPGPPQTQLRHRFSSKNGVIRQFDPCSQSKKELRLRLKRIFKEFPPPGIDEDTVPVVSFVFYFQPPKSMKKADVIAAEKECLIHTAKPDTDNLVKYYLDCMSSISFADDKEVQIGFAVKLYSYQPRTEILLSTVRRQLQENRGHQGGHRLLESLGVSEGEKLGVSTISLLVGSECRFLPAIR